MPKIWSLSCASATGCRPFLTGLGNGLVLIKPLNLGESPFKVGDIIVTSGNGGLYQPNIPFARVIRKTSDGALAMPLADPANTPYAIVMKPYQAEARNAQQAIAPDGATRKRWRSEKPGHRDPPPFTPRPRI